MATFNNGESLASVRTKINDAIDKIDGNATISNDISVGGNITVTGTVDGRDVAADGTTLDAVSTTYLPFSGGTMTGNLSFGDNDKAIFGAGSDLQIYSDGSSSFIAESGSGNLVINAGGLRVNSPDNAETLLKADVNGAVQLRYDNAAKLDTTSTGIDVTGTVTADGLTVDGATRINDSEFFIADNNTGTTAKLSMDIDATNGARIRTTVNGATSIQPLGIYTGSTLRQKYDTNGDISFYEDTGTTAKFFWDASAERLGIGTSSPSYALDVDGEIRIKTNTNSLVMQNNTSSDVGVLRITGSNNVVLRDSTNSDALTIDSNGRVGIGTSSPSRALTVYDASNSVISIRSSNSGVSQLTFGDDDDNVGSIIYSHSGLYMAFTTETAEAMRITSSGNLLVGTTNSSIFNASSGTGMVYRSGVALDVAREATGSGQPCINLNMTGTDGDHIIFYKDGSSVGSIGTDSNGDFVIDGSANHSGLRFKDNTVVPKQNGSDADNAIDLGKSDKRWKDLYLSGGIYLGGTGAANYLDDYEEGTWTPTHSGNTMYGTGYYVKVGKIVSIIADVTAPPGSGTTSIITGLPFSAISTHAAVYVGYTNTSSNAAGGYTSGSQIHFIKNGVTAAASIVAGERVIFSATYYTDS